MTEPGPEPRPRPENPKFRTLGALQSRVIFASSDLKNNLNAINPQFKEVPELTKENVKNINEHDYSLFNAASTNERVKVKKEEFEAKKREWADKCVDLLHTDTRAANLKRFFGADPNQVNNETMLRLYDTYFTGDGKTSNTQIFVKQVIEIYTVDGKINVEDLQKDMESIRWFARIFGANSGEIAAQLIDAESRLINNPDEFITQGNRDRNNVESNSQDEKLLTFLWNNRDFVTTQEAPPTKPDTDTTPQEPFVPDKEYAIQQLFQEIKGPVVKDHPYFVEDPPQTLELTAEKMQAMRVTSPYFINIEVVKDDAGKIMGVNANANRDVVPYEFALGEVNDYNETPNPNRNERYVKGLQATHDDSGLLALAAASAGDPERQARLFHAVADAMVKIHQISFRDEKPPLFSSWYLGQTETASRWTDPKVIDSLRLFESFDKIPNPTGGEPKFILRPKNELLLEYDETTQQLKPMPEQLKLWQSRVEELQNALAAGKLKTEHLRWLELLSHTVNVPELIKMAQKPVEPGKPEQTPTRIVINTIEELMDGIQKTEPGKSLDIQITEDGLKKIVPEIVMEEIKSSDNPLVKALNPKLVESESSFTVVQSGDENRGSLNGIVVVQLALGPNVKVNIEFRNREIIGTQPDIIPLQTDVQPPAYRDQVVKALENFSIAIKLKEHLLKKLGEGAEKTIGPVGLKINKDDKAVDGQISIIKANDGTTATT